MRWACVGILGLLLVAACDSELTCEVLADENNCWASAAATARACLAPNTEVGVLSVDRTTCTFSDGSQVVFDDALPNSTQDLERLGLTIYDSTGAECARFVDTFNNRMELTTDAGTVISELRGEFYLRCPGGPTYSSSFDRLFDCIPEGGPPPTDGFDVTPTGVEFYISAVTTPGPLFTCAQ